MITPTAITIPTVAPGEIYAGIVLNPDGSLSHHLILLPGEAESLNWADAKAWAAEAGGVLPSRQEQSLLFANAGQHFKDELYWSGQAHAKNDAWAWSQYFYFGSQVSYHKLTELRARAVRRLPI